MTFLLILAAVSLACVYIGAIVYFLLDVGGKTGTLIGIGMFALAASFELWFLVVHGGAVR